MTSVMPVIFRKGPPEKTAPTRLGPRRQPARSQGASDWNHAYDCRTNVPVFSCERQREQRGRRVERTWKSACLERCTWPEAWLAFTLCGAEPSANSFLPLPSNDRNREDGHCVDEVVGRQRVNECSAALSDEVGAVFLLHALSVGDVRQQH